MYTYSEPLPVTRLLSASANFASQAALSHPTTLAVPKRSLDAVQILGIGGVIGTAGTGTISLGDGTTVARYGTIVLKAGLAAGAPLEATFNITEDGFHIGVSDTLPDPALLVLTFSGTAVVTNLMATFGHFN